MYDTGGLLPVDSLPAGVFLCTGPPMVGKRALLLRLLAHGIDSGEGCVVVSTDRTAAEIDDDLAGFRRDPSATVPLGYVDGSGNAEDGVAGVPTEMAGSPTDLTGIGMGLSRQLERMATAGEVDGIRVGLLSLSTMLLYSDPERVLRYLHVFGQRTKEAGALALVLAHSESLDTEVAGQIRSFADGAIELREDEDGHRLRIKGLDGVDSGWGSVPDPRISPSGPAAVPDRPPESPPVASLRALIDDVRADQPTLTVGNYTGDEATLDRIESHFRTLQVGVRTTDLGFASPTDVALLHRGDDLLATASVADVDAAITLGDEGELAGATAPLLVAVDQTTFDATGADRRFLVRTSHTSEALAARGGRLHAGFQQLSRLWDDGRTRRNYERLVDSGVDVHVYGVADVDLPDRDWTVHTAEGGELERTWFVCYRSGEDAATEGILVAEEGADGYDGIWSYRSDLAAQLDAYLRTSY